MLLYPLFDISPEGGDTVEEGATAEGENLVMLQL